MIVGCALFSDFHLTLRRRYLYGQYKRINKHCGQVGRGLLWGGATPYQKAQGYGVAYFAKALLEDKGLSLAGKRCVITGSNYVRPAPVPLYAPYTFPPPAHSLSMFCCRVDTCSKAALLFNFIIGYFSRLRDVSLSPAIRIIHWRHYAAVISLLHPTFHNSFFIPQVALALAEKLLELGAIPLTFTDSSGAIFEPSGFSEARLKVPSILLKIVMMTT